MNHPVEEALKEPLEGIDACVDAVFVHMLFQLWQELLQQSFVVCLEPKKLWEALDEEAMHRETRVDHELRECPKDVLLFIQVHKEQSRDLRHALAIADLRAKRHDVTYQLADLSQHVVCTYYARNDMLQKRLQSSSHHLPVATSITSELYME